MKPNLNTVEEAARFMQSHDRFLVLSHVNPDGDATGSALGVVMILEQLGKEYVVVNEGETPVKFNFLPRFEQLRNLSTQPLDETFEAVIAVDCADESRMGDVRSLFGSGAALLNIDHHPTNDGFGSINLIRTDAAATAEILYDVAVAAGVSFNEELALCIYTGLLTDTGGFRYSNTSPHVMEIASQLLRYGVKPGEVAERCLEEITLAHVKMLRLALQSLEMSHENLVASITVHFEDFAQAGAGRDDTGGLVNYCRNIEGVEVGVSFVESEVGAVKVSLRARDRVDVSAIAKQLGGGGHAKAAGCTIRGSLQDAKGKVWLALGEALGVNSNE
ncbi:DHH family phosphoesterase [Brevibacillus centrosporus]|uniref:Phosphoesterase RecJ domain-containing protein n=1 Tax=Brevibacillus centrosporus TaxID=54910 RepID=A0A1I3NVS5_9BACL|nr:bifunctional oligoribonuclease/PAP phosphatase NrnA [Brevibacillus centrosporus]MEC2128487.1 bifunctional oligoribonuclease/PAP phosphatase NrnA [Brevibacillus centrosporus]MED4909910.1 bifunctional oligoribonuclease/PAP phosphatase NrnA [Brevibacillus centrosporus]RNB73671.1 bifunctional oligoribonuclease/PAP phosphatase NrnA [Brevibacillus centrosporus]SFJ13267.1 phosphoesterase RecJ domain-containing protein [Brevibacillus centrosporus]GED29062.1 DHH family phosphoesterase [Brevibacillus